MNGKKVYHFTDSAHLPWILSSGVLRASEVKPLGWPADLLWATEDGAKEATATGAYGSHYRSGSVFLVRIELGAEHFFPWPEVMDRLPAWQDKHVNALNTTAREKGSDPSRWWCRDRTVAVGSFLAIHGRTWANGKWDSVDPDLIRTAQHGKNWLGVPFRGKTYLSTQIPATYGRTTYVCANSTA